ncbi:ROK family protein [Dactylosporangium sp. McL0621]|uniref:ROK family protein n=1 Tax=Dactylosporangium sp. McL0621 TaxID=3415678 RepID=UPI003CECE4BE
MKTVLGIDIGGTKIAAALVSADGTTGPLHRVPTPAREGPAAVLRAAAELGRRVMGDAPVTACGVGTAGAVDPHGRITHATDSLPGWAGTDVRGELAAALGRPVLVRNDVHTLAVAEAAWGAAAGAGTVLVVAVGTGIGGAVVAGGELVTGRLGLAGSIGHLPAAAALGRRCGCGALDHVEAYAAGPAIAADHARRAGLAAVPPLERVDPGAAAVAFAAGVLGRGLAAAANLLDPDAIILGGGVLGLGEPFRGQVVAALRAAALPGVADVPVRAPALGPAAVLAGAAQPLLG